MQKEKEYLGLNNMNPDKALQYLRAKLVTQVGLGDDSDIDFYSEEEYEKMKNEDLALMRRGELPKHFFWNTAGEFTDEANSYELGIMIEELENLREIAGVILSDKYLSYLEKKKEECYKEEQPWREKQAKEMYEDIMRSKRLHMIAGSYRTEHPEFRKYDDYNILLKKADISDEDEKFVIKHNIAFQYDESKEETFLI